MWQSALLFTHKALHRFPPYRHFFLSHPFGIAAKNSRVSPPSFKFLGILCCRTVNIPSVPLFLPTFFRISVKGP